MGYRGRGGRTSSGSSSVTISQITDRGATGADLLATATAAAARAVLGVSSDTPLPVGDATHFWRLDDTAPHADIGSATHANMTEVVISGNSWLYHRERLYRAFDATLMTVSSWHDSMQADINAVTGSWTLGLTAGKQRGSVDGALGGSDQTLVKFFDTGSGDLVTISLLGTSHSLGWAAVCGGANYGGGAPITMDWNLPHRVTVRWNAATSTLTLIADGITQVVWALGGAPHFTGLRRINVGGALNGISTPLLYADVTFHDRALSDAELLAEGNACSRLF